MYLETIYILLQRNGSVRSMDIADYMDFTRPSVCRGVGLLKKGNYILMDQDGFITLTDTGREAAKKNLRASYHPLRFSHSPGCR